MTPHPLPGGPCFPGPWEGSRYVISALELGVRVPEDRHEGRSVFQWDLTDFLRYARMHPTNGGCGNGTPNSEKTRGHSPLSSAFCSHSKPWKTAPQSPGWSRLGPRLDGWQSDKALWCHLESNPGKHQSTQKLLSPFVRTADYHPKHGCSPSPASQPLLPLEFPGDPTDSSPVGMCPGPWVASEPASHPCRNRRDSDPPPSLL